MTAKVPFPTPTTYDAAIRYHIEICGAVKNIIALASGVVTGLGYGYNTTAAIITRGIADITRLVLALGGLALIRRR